LFFTYCELSTIFTGHTHLFTSQLAYRPVTFAQIDVEKNWLTMDTIVIAHGYKEVIDMSKSSLGTCSL